jgi:hypothetical protein
MLFNANVNIFQHLNNKNDKIVYFECENIVKTKKHVSGLITNFISILELKKGHQNLGRLSLL